LKSTSGPLLTVVKRNVEVPEWTRSRHLFTGKLTADKAVTVAERRNGTIAKTTIFESPEEFWLCQSKEKYGDIEVVVSTKPVRTYQVRGQFH
jgi:hypothetical protein